MKNFVLVAAVALAAALALGTAAGSRVPKAPDLVDASIGKAPAHAAPGLRFTLMNVVANRGGARARPSVTRFSLRSGTTSRLAGLRRTPALKPHESVRSRVRLQVPASAPAASYSLIACVDATHAVKEADERDNCRTARARLQVQPPVAPQPAPAPTPSPGATDSDRDGTPDTADCAPQDASIHPGATDTPDLKFVDSNCDGIDGDAAKSIFVAPGGKDTNPGTRSQPKGTVAGAVVTAAKSGSAVLVAAGTYSEGGGVELLDNVGIYGGYAPSNWSRSNANATMIAGSPQAVFADGVRGATLQFLTLRSGTAGQSPGASTYAVRAINRSKLTIEQSNLQSSDGFAGAAGLDGAAGENGATGRAGGDGDDDHLVGVPGGPGGPSSIGATGGHGGHGGVQVEDGETGLRGAGPSGGAGGAGGEAGDPGVDGRPGSPGGDGPRVGVPGVGGVRGVDLAGATWRGHDGADGTAGEPGSGGGGGGGGGGQHCILCTDGTGSGGGGGGAGGLGGSGGSGGHAGGGSFGVYLRDSEVHLTAGTTIRTGTGGAGGAGGRAGTGGFGGPGGPGGGKSITSGEIGRGGDGGRGGFGTHGGAGGGGAGGPSIGVFKVGASQADVDPGVSIVPGPGGGGGNGGTPGGIDGQGGYSAGVYAAS